ncbi:uncharacterized protein LOC123201167 [Mangifera indica]|uniref:uncharacterized protein LOC123201167 n=1 Tax=Mangifera indica TaxID=29780 RepID=UPI001CFAC581|nr:uncharacterized protein LOC123201167 [Mangifera indica]
MANQEKLKKGFMSFYKSKINHKPKSQPLVNHVTEIQPDKPVPVMSRQKSLKFLLKKQLENCEESGDNKPTGGGGGRSLVEARKSVSQVETNVASVMSFLQVKVLASDMPGFMQAHAFRIARRTYDSLEKFSSKHIAFNIKKEFDKVCGPAWHCIVGSSFGSFVTHSIGCFLYFSMEKLYILVLKTEVQKAVD